MIIVNCLGFSGQNVAGQGPRGRRHTVL